MLTNQTNPQLSLIHEGYTMLRQKGHIWLLTQQDEIPKHRHLIYSLILIFNHLRAQWCDVTHELRCNKDNFTIVCLQGHGPHFSIICGGKLQSFPRFQFQCTKSFFYAFAHGETLVVRLPQILIQQDVVFLSLSMNRSAKALDSFTSHRGDIHNSIDIRYHPQSSTRIL